MATIIFTATEISGLANPTYPSAATSKKWTDATYIGSGNAITRFADSSNIIHRFKGSSNIWKFVSSQAYSGVRCDDVIMDSIGLPISLCEFNSHIQSCFLLSGGHITAGTGPTGSISIGEGLISIRTVNSDHSDIYYSKIVASSNITLGTGYHYIFVDYNNGYPRYTHQIVDDSDGNTKFRIGWAYNDWTSGTPPETHIIDSDFRGDNFYKRTNKRFRDVYGMERESGLVVASSQVTGHPLAISITAGAMWKGINRFATDSRDTGLSYSITALNQTNKWFVASGGTSLFSRGKHLKVDGSTGNDGIYIISSTAYASGTTKKYIKYAIYQSIPNATVDGHLHPLLFDYYYRNGSVGWKIISGQTSLNVTNYDDGDGTLGTLTVNRYGVHWVYVDAYGHPVVLFGQGDYTLAQAENATTPSTVPTLLNEFGIFICRVITQKSITDLTTAEFAVPWTTTFTAGSVDLHNDLGGLQGGVANEYYHVNSADYTNLTVTLLDNGDASSLHHHKSLYPASSLVNRALINTISSNIDTRVDSIFNYSSNARNLYANSGNVKYRFVASSISLSRYNQYVGHSGNTSKHMTTTISTNAWNGNNIAVSGVKYTSSYKYINPSGALLANLLASGNEYTKAYKSSQLLKSHALHALISSSYLTTTIQSLITSGTKYTSSYAWYNASAQKLSHLTASGLKYTKSYNWFVESGVKLSTHENDLTIHITTTDHAKWDDIADSGVKYTWVYQSIKDSGNEWYAAYKHSANSSLHSFNVANYITSTNSINRFYPSTTGKATSGSVHNLWNWSSNKSWYANSANVRFRFIESGGTKWVDLTDGGQTTLHSHAGTPSAPGGSFTANIGSDYTYGISGVKFVSSQNISGGRYIGVRISGAKDINNWNGSSWHNSGLIWDNTLSKWKSKASGGAGGATTLDALTDVTITTPLSGQVLTYMQDTAQWVNRLPSMNFNVANVRLLSGQNINLTRFKCPTGKKTYVWQCSIANSGGASISGLKIEILSGNTQLNTWGSIYKTSSNIVQQGYPLAKSAIDSNIEIRAMYSGSHKYGSQANQVQYCTAFAQVSIY